MEPPTLLHRLVLVTGLGLLCACGSLGAETPPSRAAAAANSPAPAATSPDTATTTASCTSSGPASSSWTPTPSRPAIATITAAVAGDTLTLQFDQGTPAFEVRTQTRTRFSRDPSGQPVTVAGSDGVAVVLMGFRGDIRNYAGAQTLSSNGALLRQVQEIGDSEGVITWAAGLSAPGCANVTASGSTLTILFVPHAAASVTVSDVEAVANKIYGGTYHMGCTMNDTSCPLTPRLATRLFAVRTPNAVGPGPVDYFCRCQNPASKAMSLSGEVTPTGGVAHVTLYPDVHAIKIDLIMVVQDGQLLVDDMQCTGGGRSTSVYAAQLAPCG